MCVHFCPQAFKEQELPGDIAKRIKQQEDKIQQQQNELEKLKEDTKQAQEEWQRKRQLEQNEVFQKQREELDRLKEKLKEMELRRESTPATNQPQPVRLSHSLYSSTYVPTSFSRYSYTTNIAFPSSFNESDTLHEYYLHFREV